MYFCLVLVLQFFLYYDASVFHYHTIYYYKIIIKCPVWSQILGNFSFMLVCQPHVMYPSSYCRYSSCSVACCISCIDMFSGISLALYITSMLHLHTNYFTVLVLFIILSCNQSDMNMSGPGLFIILILYWCLCKTGAISFLKIITSGKWFVIILTSLTKQ